MQNKNIKLSIIIPIYNVEKYISDCISSIYRQDFDEEEFEIIIVNDGTKDKSMEIVQSFAEQHTNIIIINQENQGLSTTRNNGMEHVNGDYVFFLDSDDMLVDHSLKPLLLQLIESGADTIQGNYIKKEDKNFPRNGITIECKNNMTITSGKERFINESVFDYYIWQNIYKTDFLKSKNLKFIPKIYFEDVAFYNEMTIKAKKYAISTITHYVYRQREGSIVSTITPQKLIHMNIACEKIWETCKDIAIKDKKCHIALTNRIFAGAISINYWYVTHYKKLYPHWKEILDDLKERIPLEIFNTTWKQRITIAFLKYFPVLYFKTRYKLNKKIYE